MAILALIMVPNLTAWLQKRDDSKVEINMKSIHTVAELAVWTNPKIYIKDIVGADDVADLEAEIAKYANLDAAKVKIVALVNAGTALDTYYISPSDNTNQSLTVTFSTDRASYTFDGKKYTDDGAAFAGAPVTP